MGPMRTLSFGVRCPVFWTPALVLPIQLSFTLPPARSFVTNFVMAIFLLLVP